MKAWRATNPQKIGAYQRAAVLESALRMRRFPTRRSIERHSLTEDELMRVVASVVRTCRRTPASEKRRTVARASDCSVSAEAPTDLGSEHTHTKN